MDLPENSLLPFAYGVFQPGELAFLRIKEHTEDAAPARVSGRLWVRDGLPLLETSADGEVSGTLLRFRPESAGRAYYRLVELEPDRQYEWRTVNASTEQGEHDANVLVGRDVTNGAVQFDGEVWRGRDDPFFKDAFLVVEETHSEVRPAPNDLRPLFRVQMGYLLLWSVLERYAALRYHLAGEVAGKIDNIASEPAFAEALRAHVTGQREVYRADDPDRSKRYRLNPENPKHSLRYYYQVRCNATHRGKAASRDYDILLESSRELLEISKHIVSHSFKQAEWP